MVSLFFYYFSTMKSFHPTVLIAAESLVIGRNVGWEEIANALGVSSEEIKEMITSAKSKIKASEITGIVECSISDEFKAEPAIYKIYDEDSLIYIGSTKNMNRRWKAHHTLKSLTKPLCIYKIQVEYYTTYKDLRSIEKSLIEKHKPILNKVAL